MTEEEIISMVDEAHEQGVIEENEAEMIQNIISFNATTASDIMTHRKQIIGFDETVLLSEMVDHMLEEGIEVDLLCFSVKKILHAGVKQHANKQRACDNQ